MLVSTEFELATFEIAVQHTRSLVHLLILSKFNNKIQKYLYENKSYVQDSKEYTSFLCACYEVVNYNKFLDYIR